VVVEVDRKSQEQAARVALITTVLVGTVIAVVVFLVRRRGLATGFVFRDTQTIGDLPWYAGALSNAGVVMWAVTAAVAIFGSRLAQDRETRGFLLSGGLLSSMLGFDDLYMVHERVFPVVLGLSERLLFSIYLVAVALYLYRFRREILDSDFALLLAALCGFGVSMVVDVLTEHKPWPMYRHVLEAGPKLVGLALWMTYHVRTTWQRVQRDGPARPARPQ
jgi:hypothetical protein